MNVYGVFSDWLRRTYFHGGISIRARIFCSVGCPWGQRGCITFWSNKGCIFLWQWTNGCWSLFHCLLVPRCILRAWCHFDDFCAWGRLCDRWSVFWRCFLSSRYKFFPVCCQLLPWLCKLGCRLGIGRRGGTSLIFGNCSFWFGTIPLAGLMFSDCAP